MVTANETLISVKGLKKHFGKLQVLKGVDIDIHSGEVVVVIGPSGSGKSTHPPLQHPQQAGRGKRQQMCIRDRYLVRILSAARCAGFRQAKSPERVGRCRIPEHPPSTIIRHYSFFFGDRIAYRAHFISCACTGA